MARPRIKGKRLQLGVDLDLVGWLEWQGHENGEGMGAYLNQLMREDRTRKLQDGGDNMRRYRMYVESLGMTSELESLEQ